MRSRFKIKKIQVNFKSTSIPIPDPFYGFVYKRGSGQGLTGQVLGNFQVISGQFLGSIWAGSGLFWGSFWAVSGQFLGGYFATFIFTITIQRISHAYRPNVSALYINPSSI